MRCKQPLFLALTVALLATSIGSTFASVTIPQRPIYFPFNNGAYLSFSTTILPLTFSGNPQSVYRDTVNRWHFGTVWITSTIDMTVTAWFSGDWLNYTVPSSGTQQISNGSKPTGVYLDGVYKLEGFGWTYTDGTLIISGASASSWVYWGSTMPNTVGYQLGQAAIIAAGFLAIVMLVAMVDVVAEKKDIKYAAMLAIGEVLLLITMLVLSQLSILG